MKNFVLVISVFFLCTFCGPPKKIQGSSSSSGSSADSSSTSPMLFGDLDVDNGGRSLEELNVEISNEIVDTLKFFSQKPHLLHKVYGKDQHLSALILDNIPEIINKIEQFMRNYAKHFRFVSDPDQQPEVYNPKSGKMEKVDSKNNVAKQLITHFVPNYGSMSSCLQHFHLFHEYLGILKLEESLNYDLSRPLKNFFSPCFSKEGHISFQEYYESLERLSPYTVASSPPQLGLFQKRGIPLENLFCEGGLLEYEFSNIEVFCIPAKELESIRSVEISWNSKRNFLVDFENFDQSLQDIPYFPQLFINKGQDFVSHNFYTHQIFRRSEYCFHNNQNNFQSQEFNVIGGAPNFLGDPNMAFPILQKSDCSFISNFEEKELMTNFLVTLEYSAFETHELRLTDSMGQTVQFIHGQNNDMIHEFISTSSDDLEISGKVKHFLFIKTEKNSENIAI